MDFLPERTNRETRMSFRNQLIAVVLVATTSVLALFVSDRRILVYEHKVNPGESYFVAEHGNLGEAQDASLHCKYFTGSAVVDTVFWHASNNILGKDTCPFITTP